MKTKILRIIRRLILILVAAFLTAFNINTFIRAGGLIPGGFTGLTLLTQEICQRYGGFHIPFTVINYALNAVPAIICFKFIGKRFTLYSILFIAVSSLLVDWMPVMFIELIQLHDILLSAIFGGLLGALTTAMCLYADATGGGTDFVAIFISEKYQKDAWNYIFLGNCFILGAAAFLFSVDKALYSFIFQFTVTISIGALYRGYQQRTLLIITNSPDEVYNVIQEKTNHGATSLEGFGYYEKKKRVLLYSVVTATQVKELIPAIRKIDPVSFINILKTEQINGRFYQKPRD